MAIKIGKKSEEGAFKLYQGVGAFNIVAVNPTKAQIEEITGRTLENEPEYKGTDDNGNNFVRVVFWAKTCLESKVNNSIELAIPFNFTITNAMRKGTNSGKIQVIDKYGRTAWGDEETVKSGAIPQYTNGPANISAGYRPAYQGEEHLVNFLIQWLNIPGPAVYKDKQWVMREDPSDSEVCLDMKAIMSGNVKEIAELVNLAKDFVVKACVGVRTTEEGKQYQNVYTRMFLKNAITNYSKLDEDIKSTQNSGALTTTEFDVQPLHEYTVETTDFNKADNDPLGANNTPASSPWDSWGK